ncbi:MAG: ArsR family transcriptional regulator [Promethearchaeota archaeon]
MDWNLFGFIKASDYRIKVIKALNDKKRTPKELSEITSIPLSHISTTLKQLIRKKVVICLTPGLRKGKLFELTKIGMDVLNELKKRH